MFKIFSLFLFIFQLAHADQGELNRAVELCLEGISTTEKSGKVLCEVDKSIKKSTLSNIDNKKFDVSVISYDYLLELYQWISSQKHIPFQYPEDGCYARAHEMARLLESKGVIAGKTFIEGDLRVETKNSPKGYVEWWYHVAPVVKVNQDGQEKIYVLDPSIFDKPVPVEEWYNIQTKHQRGRTDASYYTPRFNFEPYEKMDLLKAYDPEDVKATKEVMEEYMSIQKQRASSK